MSEELHRMKRVFARQEPIRSREDTRKAAIDAALQRFATEMKMRPKEMRSRIV